ncbi:MAG: hypothetical protein GF392_03345 [Candidatus Omnitrophica bacterium]|nr:hypothetical protein [Candidatus Omnitrophota bacterium]
MKLLVAMIPMPCNRFLADLNGELSKHCEITHSSEIFWKMEGSFDIVHIHFPEYITFEVEDAYRKEVTDNLIHEAEKRLKFWAEKARIVITRHNILPHDIVGASLWEKMYETVYRYADGVVHFGKLSIKEFRKRYRDLYFYRGHEPRHVIIPHQNYASLPNDIGCKEARYKLGISQEAEVVLVFGGIRNDDERKLILDTFRGIRSKKKVLLVSNWREKLAKVSWIRLKYWLRDLARLYYRLHPHYCFNYGFVEEKEAQTYFNAADILFIPRFYVLNSGNITCGMTFGKVVVGPDSWDVGEILKAMGNPVFDPDRPETAVKAVEEALQLSKSSLGEKNREIALREWSVERCASKYLGLFKTLVFEK